MQNILFFQEQSWLSLSMPVEKMKLIVYFDSLTSILAGLPTAVVKSGMSQITTAPHQSYTICQFLN
jgi:hypothetical protein